MGKIILVRLRLGGGGGWGGGGGVPLVEKRLVSFIYLIVDNKIILLSVEFILRSPYKYKRNSFFK